MTRLGENELDPAKILVVDDRQENLVAMRKVLEDVDVELLLASSGADALSMLIRHEVAVILLDVEMPFMDGIETATLIRGNQDTEHVPIIFVTATQRAEGYFSAGYDAGAVDYLTKPINEEILRSKVNIFLDLHRQSKALQQKARDLEKAQQELERSNNALGAFASAAAHDLQAPVRHIRAWTEMLLLDEADTLSDNALGCLDVIEQSAIRMHSLISALLEYARVDATPPEMSRIDLNCVIAAVSEDLDAVVSETEAQMTTEPLPAITGNAPLLRQLFQNLVGNALKYHRPDVAPEIQVACEIDILSGFAEISIIDNGIGFDESLAASIFEPFRRLVPTSEFEGSGIGMATAKKIVDLHGGSISASSCGDHGSTFKVALPLAAEVFSLRDPEHRDRTPVAG
ncbi:MAG: response regulator [Actinomycetia bacterium]|nr:response regulator [Actinomycetes bacterium]MCP4958163.1 response regulator [Actinomycetes bacterium]